MIIKMDDLMARLQEQHSSRWNSPPPSPGQYVEVIWPSGILTTGATSGGRVTVIPPASLR